METLRTAGMIFLGALLALQLPMVCGILIGLYWSVVREIKKLPSIDYEL